MFVTIFADKDKGVQVRQTAAAFHSLIASHHQGPSSFQCTGPGRGIHGPWMPLALLRATARRPLAGATRHP